MIDDSPRDLIDRAHDGEDYVDDHIQQLGRMIESYTGPSYVTGSQRYARENSYFNFCGLYVPQLVFRTPQFRVRTVRSGDQKVVAVAGSHGLNRLARQTRMKRPLEHMALDGLFGFGIYQVGLRAHPDPLFPIPQKADIASASQPYVARVPQDRFQIDPEARDITEADFLSIRFSWDYEDILEQAKAEPKKWNQEVVRALRDSAATSNERDRDEIRPVRDGQLQRMRHAPNKVEGYVMWVPSHSVDDAEEHEHGMIYTVVEYGVRGSEKNRNPAHLRPPRSYFGHPFGPWAMFGVYDVPGEPLPLGPLTAMDRNIQELSATMEAMEERAEEYRRIAVAPGEIVDEIMASPDNYLIGIETADFDKSKLGTAEVGGVAQHDVAWASLVKGTVDRGLSISDALEGNVTGRGTATENHIASVARETRSSRILDRFTDAVGAIGERYLYLMYAEDSIVFPLGEAGSRALGMDEAWWEGGVGEGEPYSFYDLELEVDALTLGRRGRAERQALADKRFMMIGQMAQLQMQAPFVRCVDELRLWGEAHDFYDLDEAIDLEVLEQVLQGLVAQPQIPQNVAMFRGFAGEGVIDVSKSPGQKNHGADITGAAPALNPLTSPTPGGTGSSTPGSSPLLGGPGLAR
jgi:hypothetical protein